VFFHATQTRDDEIARVNPVDQRRVAADAAIECINCAVCYASCDTVRGNPDYLGPAALNRAWTLINDVKDGKRASILDAVSQEGGCHNCHSQGSCAKFCPNELSPITSIAGLKRETMKVVFREAVMLTIRLFVLQRVDSIDNGTASVGASGVDDLYDTGRPFDRRNSCADAGELVLGSLLRHLCGRCLQVHAAIGVRVIIGEALRVRGVVLDLLCLAFGAVLLFAGLRAVLSVTML
jgi:heterodisulfide reductase subunit C